MSYDDRTPAELIGKSIDEIRDDELARLLEDVHRIAEGVDGFRELAVKLTAGPAPVHIDAMKALQLPDRGPKGSAQNQQPSTFSPDENEALDALDREIIGALRSGAMTIVISLDIATRINLLASTAWRRR